MIKNYLKIAWRNLIKNRSVFSINVLGLALGIATALLIVIFVADEFSYDAYHKNANNIARVVLKGQMGGEVIKEAVSQAPVAPTLVAEFPEVLAGTRLRRMGYPLVTYQNNAFRESRFAYIDANFFEVFTLPFLKGNPNTALKEPNTVVITEEQAKKYFGNEDPMGKTLRLKEWEQDFRVTGVIENVPQNSHVRFDLWASMKSWDHAQQGNWLESHYHTYLLLNDPEDLPLVESKLPNVLNTHMGPQMKEAMGLSFEEFQENGNQLGMFLQPLTDIHLHSDFSDMTNLAPGGSIKTVYTFLAIAIFVLLVASINFMTLSTASASKRAKEVGIKKVLGSQRKQLVGQFLSESLIVVTIAMLMGILLVAAALPAFNNLTGKTLGFTQLITVETFFYILSFILVLSLFSGFYPAFFLSSFNPISALKNRLGHKKGNQPIRSGLVVFQFAVAVALIIATLVVKEQLNFVLNKDVGYDKHNILVLKDSWKLGDNENAFKETLQSDARVASVTNSGFVPAGPTSDHMTSIYPEDRSEELRRTIAYEVDDQYLKTMGIELLKGRNFSTAFKAEDNNLIVNETSAKILGFGLDAVGKTVTMSLNNEGATKKYTIVGVIKDFHYKSLYQPVEPLIMMYKPNPGLLIKARAADMAGLIAKAEGLWNSFGVQEPFSYGLLDDLYNQTYIREQKTGTLLQLFTFLTLFIGCLGLFALATFSAQQKVKEIGIRKVLGASANQLSRMLSRDFLKLVVVSFLIAFPVGYYFMDLWLQDFAYHIQIKWWIFALAGILTLLIALATISFQAIKAAMANPIKSLRTE